MKNLPIRSDAAHAPVMANTARKQGIKRLRAPRNWKAARAANKVLLLAELSRQQVSLATMHYEGQGDEGAPATINLFLDDEGEIAIADPVTTAAILTSIWASRARPDQAECKATRFVRESMTIEEAVESVGWEAVEYLHGGFWDGAGGQGDVRFHPGAGTLVVSHDDYITDTIHTETRL